MLSWEELKKDRDLVSRIDWEITPQEAFEAYQLKSPGNWRHRNLPQVYYFYLSTWKGQAKVLLVKRHYTESEELCQAPVPTELVDPLAAREDGEHIPRGQMPLDEAIKDWLRKELSA